MRDSDWNIWIHRIWWPLPEYLVSFYGFMPWLADKSISRLLLASKNKYVVLIRSSSLLSLSLSLSLSTHTHTHIYHHHHHHHHIALVARISLTLSRHSSLSFIALGRSSGQHPVSSYSCWMYVRAGRPAFARPCVGIHKSTSLMSSSLLLQQCPACLVRLTWIVFVIGGRWPYSWCLVGCCCQELFRIARKQNDWRRS